jgi:hypothetical protein
MRLLIIMLSLTLLGASCNGYKVRPDHAPDYIGNGYLSAETEICGSYRAGINGCHFRENSPTDGKFLYVQGVRDGEIAIYSRKCRVDESYRYTKNAKLAIPLSDIFGTTFEKEEACTLNVEVYPDFIADSEIPVFGRRAKVWMDVIQSDAVVPAVSTESNQPHGVQIRKQARKNTVKLIPRFLDVEFPIGFKGKWQVVDCVGTAKESTFEGTKLRVDLDPFYAQEASCRLQFAAVSEDRKIYIWNFYVQAFHKDLVKFPPPEISLSDNDSALCAKSSPSVTTFTAINDEYANDDVACVDYSPEKLYYIRAFTVKRNSVSAYQGGKILWRN